VIKLSSVLLDGDRAAIYVLHSTFLEYLHSMLRDLLIMIIPNAEALVLSSALKYNICGILQPSTNQMNGSEDDKMDLKLQLHKSTTPALHYAPFHGLVHITASLHTLELYTELSIDSY
jgi:hypothetical protein